MKIILLHDISGLGKKYDIKTVSDGHARNFLFPRKLAEIATEKAIQSIETKKHQLKQEKNIQQDLLEKNIEKLEGLTISLKEKVNEKGHLFASVHPSEISKIIKEQHHLDIPEEMIELEKAIKEIGEYNIQVKNKKFKLLVAGN